MQRAARGAAARGDAVSCRAALGQGCGDGAGSAGCGGSPSSPPCAFSLLLWRPGPWRRRRGPPAGPGRSSVRRGCGRGLPGEGRCSGAVRSARVPPARPCPLSPLRSALPVPAGSPSGERRGLPLRRPAGTASHFLWLAGGGITNEALESPPVREPVRSQGARGMTVHLTPRNQVRSQQVCAESEPASCAGSWSAPRTENEGTSIPRSLSALVLLLSVHLLHPVCRLGGAVQIGWLSR